MEREAEHVRMMDVGRLRARYASSLPAPARKFQLHRHGNTHGLTFVAAENGFEVVKADAMQVACQDYVKRRQVALDHGEKLAADEIHAAPVEREVSLDATAHVLALSPDELLLAVAHGDGVSLFEVAEILQSENPQPFHSFASLSAQEVAWCPDAAGATFAVLTTSNRVVLCDLEGAQKVVAQDASSVSWGPSGSSLAVGTKAASVIIYSRESLVVERTIERPDCCEDDSFSAHHVNWAEDDVILVGYQKYDEDGEETTALACLFENGACIELDELVAYFDVEGRRHQYYSVYLPDWRMFFVGCSLSADIELLVWDPDEEAWQVWKPAEKYQARLPMTSDDEDTFPMGLSLDLNATEAVQVDEKPFPPAPIITCTTSEGLLISFAFVDTSVYEELDFITKAVAFDAPVTRAPISAAEPIKTPVIEQESATQSDILNVPAPEDSDDSDSEEEREEERQNAIDAFNALDIEQKGEIDASKFAELIEKMGTTYCEEDHSKYAERLSGSSGVIKKTEFAAWYVTWVFGGDEEDEEEDDSASTVTQTPSSAVTVNPLAKFQMKEGSWRCDVCSVQNPDASAPRCASCESPNPNFKGPAIGATTSAKPLSSFGFGGAQESSAKPSFSFGFSAPTSGSNDSVTGFAAFSSSSTTTTTPGSFTFGFTAPSGDDAKPATASAAPTGFVFNASASTKDKSASTSTESTKPAATTTATAESKPAETESYGQNDINTFAGNSSDDDDDDDEEEERRQEEEKARDAFRAVVPDGETSIALENVPKLIKKLGATYCEEDHDSRMKKLAKDGMIHETDFVGWYVNWIFDDGSSDEEDEDDTPASASEVKQMKSSDEIAVAFKKFQPAEGSWKCDVCMVSNPSSGMKCSACETPNPSAPKGLTPPKTIAGSAPASIGSGGFSFPVNSSRDSKPSFSFGFSSSTATESASADTKPVGGFSFTSIAKAEDKPASGGGFSFNFGTGAASTTSQAKPETGLSLGTGATTTSTPSQPEAGEKPASTSSTAPSGAYPPDTTTKPKLPTFGGAESSGGYPPDTTKKPTPPAFGGAASSGGYPPDTTTKPKPPAFGGAASSSGYPPDTTTKPKPPAFGGGGYPPDTTTKPTPPAFGGAASSGGYPPDTTTKPKPPAFGGGGYPPDTTTKANPPAFGSASSSLFGSASTTKSTFSFGSFGSALQKDEPSSSSGSSSTSAPSPFGSKLVAGSFGTAANSGAPAASPFGVVPKAPAKNVAFSFAPRAGAAAAAQDTSAKKTSFEFKSGGSAASTASSSTGSVTKPTPTQRKLAFGATDESTKVERTASPPTPAKADDRVAVPASVFEGKLWTLISDFDKALKRVNKSSASIKSKDKEFTGPILKKLASLRGLLADLCADINTLDAARDEVEKNVLFVIGRDGDVHEQLEYSREILTSFDDKAFKKSVEEQPLDDRSRETREALKAKFEEVERSCADLENHLATSGKANAHGAASSAHLFRVLKQTYENSKLQYNRVCLLAEQVDKLSLQSELVLPSKSSLSTSRTSRPAATADLSKDELADTLSEAEERSRAIRKHFLALCNNTVSPRVVYKGERQKPAAMSTASSASSSTSPLRIKANTKLMPRAQMTIASPISSAKASTGSISFKETPVKSGSRLFPVPEEKSTKPPSAFASATQVAKPTAPVATSNKRPNLSTPAAAAPSAEKKSPISTFSFPKSSVPAASKPSESGSTAPTAFGEHKSGFSLDAKSTGPQSPFSLGGKEASAKSFAAWSTMTEKKIAPSAAKPTTTTTKTATPDYKALLTKFYEEHNATKLAQVDKIIKEFGGREKALFQRLFAQYVPGSSDAEVNKYLQGGPVPKKPASAAASPTPATATASAFGTVAAKPMTGGFGVASGSTSATAAKPTSSFGFGGGFGAAVQATTTPVATATSAPSASPFGAPAATSAVDYRQKLIDFYQKHNPSKLASVDATLAKYKGNEAKLFQSLATKYNVALDALGNPASSQPQPPSTPVLQSVKTNPAASPFGNANSFATINTPQQSAPSPFGGSGGFGTNPAAASPFGTPQAAATGGFGTASSTGFGTSSGFGGGFGTAGSSAAAAPAFGTGSQLGGGFGATNHREKLIAFYQQHNPEKLGTVDATLAKYNGQEDRLFAMLEQKYLKKAPAAGGFGGIPTTNAFGGGAAGFGAPSALGAASASPAFGSASTLGGPAPAFGGAAAPAFGSASSLGGASAFGAPSGFGAPAAASSSAAPVGGGFSSFGTQGTSSFASFGGAAAGAGGGFGGAAAGGGGGFGSFGGAAGGFGQQAASFSNPSFTQMR